MFNTFKKSNPSQAMPPATNTMQALEGSAPPRTPPAPMDLDQAPVLPPLEFDRPEQGLQLPDWNNAHPPSLPAPVELGKPEEPSNLDLAAMFEQRCRRWIEAINAKDFGPTSYIWQDKTPNWKSRRACNFIKGQSDVMDIYEFVETTKNAATYQPNVRLLILDCTTNIYRNDSGKVEFAETFSNLEVSGAPPGITRRAVAVYNWRLIGGKWLGTGHKSLPGMVVMGPDCMY